MRKWFPLSGIIALLIVANPRLDMRALDPFGGGEPQQSVPHVFSRGGAPRPIQELSFEQNIATYGNGSLILGGYLGPLKSQRDSHHESALDVSRSAPARSTAFALPHFTSPVRLAQGKEDVQNLAIANPYVPVPPANSGATAAPAPKRGVPQLNPYVRQTTESEKHTRAGVTAPAASRPSSPAAQIQILGPVDVSRLAPTTSTALAPPHFTSPVRIAQGEEDVENLLIDNPYAPVPPGSSGATGAPAPKPVVPQLNPYVRQTAEGAKDATGGASTPAVSAPNSPTQRTKETSPANPPTKDQRSLRFPDQPPLPPTPVDASPPAVRAPVVQKQSPSPEPPAQPQQPNPPTQSPPTLSPPTQLPLGSPHRYQPAPDENLLNHGNVQRLPADRGNEPVLDQPKVNNGGPNVGDIETTEPLFTAPPTSTSPPRQHPLETVPPPNDFRQDAGPANEMRPTNEMPGGGLKSTAPNDSASVDPATDPHYEVFAKSQFPSAKECAVCHKQIFEEWSVSSHAYAAVSPMFQRFEQTISSLTKGTIGYFCMRCHSPVGTTISHPRWKSIWESIPAATEGVTCIVCHRVWQDYGKVNGERRIEPGDIFAPVTGAGYGYTLQEILQKKEHYKVKTSPTDQGPGQNIHTQVVHFEQITKSEFCVSCHQVTVYPGIALEVVWAQYRASPACKEGISCQDCHMGSVPGQALGYDTAPVAVIADKEIDPGRKHSNHMFYGPGYSIAHPGVFPFRAKQDEQWTPRQWQEFDYRAGWGTERFEEAVDNGMIQSPFPTVWENADDRADAREILDQNLAKLAHKRELRRQLMEYNSKVEGPFFKRQPTVDKQLKFHYVIRNLNSGHNMPSGSLGAQPQLWLNVALTGPDGEHLWESGYVDRNGDIADLHSLEVAAGRIRPDRQLVNLQTKFLTANTNGPDREFYLPIPVDVDPLPFIRPAGLPVSVLNHPPLIRMEAHSVPPLGQRVARYHVPAGVIKQPGVYRLSVRMRSRAEPIYFMKFCRSTPEMERNMNERMLNFHEESFEFVVR